MSDRLARDDYQYDVFLSYTRNLVGDWVRDYFFELFCDRLDNSLGYRPEVFMDTKSITAGDAWPLRLKEALAYSKCLVAVVSPAYFRSPWCMKECHVMLAREAAEGFGIAGNGKGLVIPAIARDGKHHPEYIRNIQSVDFKRFVRAGGAFLNTPRYIEFEDKMEMWTEEVAAVIQQVPQWNPNWLNETVIEIPKTEPLNFDMPPRLR